MCIVFIIMALFNYNMNKTDFLYIQKVKINHTHEFNPVRSFDRYMYLCLTSLGLTCTSLQYTIAP